MSDAPMVSGGSVRAVAPPPPQDTASDLIEQTTTRAGVDTRQLAYRLSEQQKQQTPDQFRQTLEAVEHRLSPADLSRLSEDRRKEASLDSVNQDFSDAARPAANDAVRLLQRPQGAVRRQDVVSTLDELHQARMNPAATPQDRQHLLSLYMGVYERGQAEAHLPPKVTAEVMEFGLGSMLFSGSHDPMAAGFRGGGAEIVVPPRPASRFTPAAAPEPPPTARQAKTLAAEAPKPRATPTVGRHDLNAMRAANGIPQDQQTIAVGRTDAPGLEGRTFEGASPKVRARAEMGPTTPGPYKSPGKIALDRDHAEQDMFNQFDAVVKAQGHKPSDLNGKTLTMHISNPTGVCTTCRQGLGSDKPPGVIKQISQAYPGLTIHITVETQSGVTVRGPTEFTVRNGAYVDRR